MDPKFSSFKNIIVILGIFSFSIAWGLNCDLLNSIYDDYSEIKISINGLSNYCPSSNIETNTPEDKYLFYDSDLLNPNIILKINNLTINTKCGITLWRAPRGSGLFTPTTLPSLKCLIPLTDVNTNQTRYVEAKIETPPDLGKGELMNNLFNYIIRECTTSGDSNTTVSSTTGPLYLKIFLDKFYRGKEATLDSLEYSQNLDGKFKIHDEENLYCWLDYNNSQACSYGDLSYSVRIFRDVVSSTYVDPNSNYPFSQTLNFKIPASLSPKFFNIINKSNFIESIPFVPTFYLKDSNTLNVDLRYFYNYKYILPEEIFDPEVAAPTSDNCSVSVVSSGGGGERVIVPSGITIKVGGNGRGKIEVDNISISYYADRDGELEFYRETLRENFSVFSSTTIDFPIDAVSTTLSFKLTAVPTDGSSKFSNWQGFCNITSSSTASTTSEIDPKQMGNTCEAVFRDKDTYEFKITNLLKDFRVEEIPPYIIPKFDCRGDDQDKPQDYGEGKCNKKFLEDTTFNLKVTPPCGSTSKIQFPYVFVKRAEAVEGEEPGQQQPPGGGTGGPGGGTGSGGTTSTCTPIEWEWTGDCAYLGASTTPTITITKNMNCGIKKKTQELYLPQFFSKIKYQLSSILQFFNNLLLKIKNVFAVGGKLSPNTLPPNVTIELWDNDNNVELSSTTVKITATSVSILHDFYSDLTTTTKDGSPTSTNKEYLLRFKFEGGLYLDIPFILDGNQLEDVIIAGMNCGGIIQNRKPKPEPQKPSPYFTYKRICLTNKGDTGSILRVKLSTSTTSTIPQELSNFKHYFKYQPRWAEGEKARMPLKWKETKIQIDGTERWINNTSALSDSIKIYNRDIIKIGADVDDTDPLYPNVIFSFPNLCYFDPDGCQGRTKYATYTLVFKGKAVKEDKKEEEITNPRFSSTTIVNVPLIYLPPPPKINLSINTNYDPNSTTTQINSDNYYIFAVTTTEEFKPFIDFQKNLLTIHFMA
jgi:hypothetical protein